MVRHDFNIKQNTDWGWYIIIKDPDTLAVLDITDYTAVLEARVNKGDASKIIDLSVGSGITVTPGEGKIAVALTDTQTAALDFDDAFYIFDVTDASGNIVRYLEGKLKLNRWGTS